jgi:hypothetical protein
MKDCERTRNVLQACVRMMAEESGVGIEGAPGRLRFGGRSARGIGV